MLRSPAFNGIVLVTDTIMSRPKDLVQGTLDVLILRTLEAEPLHGLAIAHRLRARSEEVLQVSRGSLYPALHKLEREKLLTAFWQEAEGRRRKYYRLTAAGRKALAARKTAWRQFADGLEGVLGAHRSPGVAEA